MSENITTVHITKVLSSSMILDLVDEYPDLKEITCSPSIYNRISKNYISALNHLEIEVNRKYNWGAKSKTNGAEDTVLKLANDGLKPKEIANELDITLNRVYYLLRKTGRKFDNRKRKYNHGQIKQMNENGMSPKEISNELDVPIRTVYYILNKK